MQVGIVGKPNVGKSTFFSALTLAPAQIAAYPFTTIEANKGVGYVRAQCPHSLIGHPCNPRNSTCEDGVRFVPIEILDVAGLVPDAHKGRGLGNQFLDDLRQAHALIHVVDASGQTDCEGNPVTEGCHDTLEDVTFLNSEISHWIDSIMSKGFDRIARQAKQSNTKLERLIHERLTGLRITEAQIISALKDAGMDPDPTKWSEEDTLRLSIEIRKISKPMIVAANKSDIAPADQMDKLLGCGERVVPTAAEYELALRRAAKAGLIEYTPGSKSFEVNAPDKLNELQKSALAKISEWLDRNGSTGVQDCLEKIVFEILDLIVVYPVEDETKWSDKDGRILPDAYLMPRGSTAKELAYKVHTDFGDNFIRAIDAKTHMTIGASHELKDGDVIKIIARA
ncbi:MAG TPA: redox-regulated ATPase YchF [Euryarchaeota archaeon]|nr:redox-regulated ATPase YchF [Euryarchaeota archaeon]